MLQWLLLVTQGALEVGSGADPRGPGQDWARTPRSGTLSILSQGCLGEDWPRPLPAAVSLSTWAGASSPVGSPRLGGFRSPLLTTHCWRWGGEARPQALSTPAVEKESFTAWELPDRCLGVDDKGVLTYVVGEGVEAGLTWAHVSRSSEKP